MYKPESRFDQYYSVEFTAINFTSLYQFKIWNLGPESMCVLVKETSGILEALRVGDRLNMKYYTTDSHCPTTLQETEIKYIKKEDNGRFKGHFLIGLTILENGNEGEAVKSIDTPPEGPAPFKLHHHGEISKI